MAKVELQYDRESIVIEIPDEHLGEIANLNEVEPRDEAELVRNALENPVDSEPFTEFIKDGELLIVVNDATRPTPTDRIIDFIHNQIKDKELKFIVACGSHSPPTENEARKIFGRYYEFYKDRIYYHNAKDKDGIEFFGRTSRGTDVYFSRLLRRADKIININSVEPHYFAGYTGGRKSFLPGLAGYETITENHSNALNINSKTLVLKGNPVHEDMEEAVEKIEREIFSINIVLERDNRMYSVSAGDLHKSFYDSIKSANDVYCIKVKERYDVVVTVASYPMDVNLYQSQKALENGKLALKDDGIIILIAKCRQGIGDETFAEILRCSDTPEGVIESIRKGYKLGYHKAGKLAEIATWAEMWGVTDLDDEFLKCIFIKPYRNDPQGAVNDAVKKSDGKVLFLPNGGLSVPMVDA